jgi:acyl carrier protein
MGGMQQTQCILCKNANYMEQLIEQLKSQIIESLNFDDLTPADIDAEAPLFGEGLGLDSIDALELIMLMDREYGIKLADA